MGGMASEVITDTSEDIIITIFTVLVATEEVDPHMPPSKPLSTQWPQALFHQQSSQESIPFQVTKCH